VAAVFALAETVIFPAISAKSLLRFVELLLSRLRSVAVLSPKLESRHVQNYTPAFHSLSLFQLFS
jgi:hypothetical protein